MNGGSERTLISEVAAQILALKRYNKRIEIQGVCSKGVEISKNSSKIKVRPRFRFTVSLRLKRTHLCYVRYIEHYQAKILILKLMNIGKNICILTDPSFYTASRIDNVITADLFPDVMKGQVKTINGDENVSRVQEKKVLRVLMNGASATTINNIIIIIIY